MNEGKFEIIHIMHITLCDDDLLNLNTIQGYLSVKVCVSVIRSLCMYI